MSTFRGRAVVRGVLACLLTAAVAVGQPAAADSPGVVCFDVLLDVVPAAPWRVSAALARLHGGGGVQGPVKDAVARALVAAVPGEAGRALAEHWTAKRWDALLRDLPPEAEAVLEEAWQGFAGNTSKLWAITTPLDLIPAGADSPDPLRAVSWLPAVEDDDAARAGVAADVALALHDLQKGYAGEPKLMVVLPGRIRPVPWLDEQLKAALRSRGLFSTHGDVRTLVVGGLPSADGEVPRSIVWQVHLKLPPAPVLDEVRVTLEPSAQAGATWPAERAALEALVRERIAEATWPGQEEGTGLVPGRPAPPKYRERAVDDALTHAVREGFSVRPRNGLSIVPQVEVTQEYVKPPDQSRWRVSWQVEVSDLRPVSAVDVVVLSPSQRAELATLLEQQYDAETYGAAAGLADAMAKGLRKRIDPAAVLPSLQMQPGRVPTRSRVAADAAALKALDPRVGEVDVELVEGVFVYALLPDPQAYRVRSLIAAVEAEASADEPFAVTADILAANPTGLGDRFELEGGWGVERRHGEVSYRVERPVGRWRVGGGLAGHLDSDEQVVLGATSTAWDELRNGVRGDITAWYAAPSASRLEQHGVLRARYGFQQVELDDAASGVSIDDQISIVDTAAAWRLGWPAAKARRGIAGGWLELGGGARHGLKAFGASRAYQQYRGWAAGRLDYTTGRRWQGFVRAERGLVETFGNPPLFELPRLGGPATVRGLEEGEQIGAALVYTQLEAGVNLGALFGQTEAQRKSFDLRPFSLLVFTDIGRTVQGLDIGTALNPFDGVVGMGFGLLWDGVQTAVGEGRVALGYAYAPASTRLDSGNVFVHFALPLDLD